MMISSALEDLEASQGISGPQDSTWIPTLSTYIYIYSIIYTYIYIYTGVRITMYYDRYILIHMLNMGIHVYANIYIYK